MKAGVNDVLGMERPSPTGEKLQQILSKSGGLEGMTKGQRDMSQGSIGSGFSSIGGNPNDRNSPMGGGYGKAGSNYGGSVNTSLNSLNVSQNNQGYNSGVDSQKSGG